MAKPSQLLILPSFLAILKDRKASSPHSFVSKGSQISSPSQM
jgi:hypothetical protein